MTKSGATVSVKEKTINQLIFKNSDSKTQENNTYFIGRGLVSSMFLLRNSMNNQKSIDAEKSPVKKFTTVHTGQ